MDIRGNSVLILGGSGLIGMAVARELMPHAPALLVISGLTRTEAEEAAAELEREAARMAETRIEPAWGDLFQRHDQRERERTDILADTAARRMLLDDLYGELTDDVVARSALGVLLTQTRPDIVVDCINTATAFAYQNVFDSAAQLRELSEAGGVPNDVIEGHLATLYLPQLIRHVQIALEAMRRAGTGFYVKVGTAGTGGM
ncbi:MAG: short-chain dehydrogenase, partial [Longimicrobiales bacterium]